MYAQDNNTLPVWIIVTSLLTCISINSQPFPVGIVSQGFSKQVSQVSQCVLLGNPHDPCCCCLATVVVTYAIVFLFQCGLGDHSVFEHGFIVTEHIRQALDRDPKHVQLIV